MPTYTSSNGTEKDTSQMALSYIYNALNKAQQNQDQDNIDALTAELEARGEPLEKPEQNQSQENSSDDTGTETA